MEKVTVRTKALSQVLFSLATAGCETVEVSVVEHAVKVEGIKDDDSRLTLHIWSKEAEETEADVGRGEKLTEEEHGWLEKGKCPKCPDHGQTYKGSPDKLALYVSCDAGHIFWVPPQPLLPEYRGQHVEEALEAAKKAEREEKTGEAEDTA